MPRTRNHDTHTSGRGVRGVVREDELLGAHGDKYLAGLAKYQVGAEKWPVGWTFLAEIREYGSAEETTGKRLCSKVCVPAGR